MPEQLRDRLQGLFIPVTTPFDRVTGDTAPIPWRDNLRKWVATPVDGIVLFGSNGEGALLDDDEKTRLTGFAREVVPAGIPLLAGVGAESTRATVRQARELARAGAEALLVSPPAYFGAYLSPAALMQHYRTLADESPVPILVYHIPKYTHVTLEAGFMSELLRHANVVGMKDSSGDLKRFAEFTRACGPSCRLFVGNASLLYTALELGAAGGIIGVGCIAPELCGALISHFRAGETGRAGQLQGRINPLHKEIVASHGAAGLKFVLDQLGYIGGPPRPPLRELGEKEKQHVARVMQGAALP